MTYSPEQYYTSQITSVENVNTKTTNSGTGWSGSTWTGVLEKPDRDFIRASILSDVGGTVFFDFSNNGADITSTFPVAGFDLATFHEYQPADLSGRYFRIRVVFDSLPSNVGIYTYYSDNPPTIISPLSQGLSGDQSATTVKSVVHGEDVQNDGTFVKGKMTVDGATLVAPSTSMVRKLFLSYFFIDVDENTDRIDYYDTTDAGTRVAFRTITYVSGSNKSQINSNVVTNL